MLRAFLLLAALTLAAGPAYRLALPGYRYEFPRDHFNHPEFQTEWWYYTGNVHARSGHRYGFELVFFRRGRERGSTDNPSVWRVDDLYMAHLAVTDIDGRTFRYAQRLNRAGPGIAGASSSVGRIWNGNWQVMWATGDVQTLSAMADGIRFQLRLTPAKAAVIHGENGVSQTGDAPGQASYYVSFPLLAVEGRLNGVEVSGTAWMDHEWFSNLLEASQTGWDWFSVQLENNTQFMLFQLRRSNGTIDPHSSGTYIAPDGRATNLRRSEFELQPMEYWTSPRTHARYAVKWHITIPRLHVALDCAAALPDQELIVEGEGLNAYWEGAAVYSGTARGTGYLEMTGYEKAVKM